MRAFAKYMIHAMATLSVAAGATAQEQSAAPARPGPEPAQAGAADVVVVGKRTSKDEIREFVGVLAEARGERQIARFETRHVCPGVLGLPPEPRLAIVNRLRRVAESAGMPVAKKKCVPNTVLVVARDRDTLMRSLSQEASQYFPGMNKQEVRKLVEDKGPAIAWQVAGSPLNADGREMPRDPDSGMYVNETILAGSRITAGGRPQIASAVVVVRADALVGLSATQLADYAAMRLFARTDPGKLKGSTPPTILGILDAAPETEVPLTLTGWDLALLRSLYTGPVNLTAAQQRSAVARGVERSKNATD